MPSTTERRAGALRYVLYAPSVIGYMLHVRLEREGRGLFMVREFRGTNRTNSDRDHILSFLSF